MRKRIFGLLAALALCLGLLPGTAEAADLPSLFIGGVMVNAENMNDVLGDGKVSAAYGNGKWTIRLNNAGLTGTISVNHTSTGEPVDAEIILSGESSVTENNDSASGISASRNLTISGRGSLTVTSEGAGAVGIRADGKLMISGADVIASSSTGNALYGVGGIEISDGKVSATAKNEDTLNDTFYPAIFTEGEMVISGGEVEAVSKMSDGIDAMSGIRISNKSSVTGTSLSYVLYSPKAISISGSTVNMTSENNAAVLSAEGVQITEGAKVTVHGVEGCLIVRDVEDDTKTGTLLIDGSTLSATAVTGTGIFVNGQATIQGGADVTAISQEHFNTHYPGYGLCVRGLMVDGSKLSASATAAVSGSRVRGGIYVGTRDTPAGGDMTVKGNSEVTAEATYNCGITVEGTLSIEGGSVNSQSTEDHGIDVGDTLLILKGSVDSTSEEYRGVNVGKLLDIRNGAAFHAKSTSSYGDEAVAVKSADGIQLGSLCVEQTGGTPGPVQISGKAATAFVDENGGKLREVTITTDSADYTEVNAAIARIPGDLSVYTSESVAALNSAKNAVNWELPSAQQDTVDGYAAAIEAAIAGLVRKPTPPPAPKTCTVRFLDGGTELASLTVREGSKAAPPDEPVKEGYRFTGWHTDPEGTEAFDFETPVTGNLTLYAKWTALPGGEDASSGRDDGDDDDEPRPPAATATAITQNPDGSTTKTTTDRRTGTVTTVTTAPDGTSVTVVTDQNGHVVSTEASVPKGTAVLPAAPEGEVKITVKGGGRAEVTLPAESAGPGTVAVLLSPEGSKTVARKSILTENGVVLTVQGSAVVRLEDRGRTFPDVPEGWKAEAAAFASAREILNGGTDGLFRPDAPMTRAMLAVALHNLEGNPFHGTAAAFLDVPEHVWYAEAVSWASARGIVTGYTDEIFGPGDCITREQLAVMLWRAAGRPAPSSRLLPFPDADQAADYAREALCWAVEHGIIRGGSGGMLAPKGLATRAQTAQMLKNFLENG